MKKILMMSLAVLVGSATYAQSTETIFIIQDTKDGEQVVDVRYREKPSDFEIDGFHEADQNGDGCIDRTEARDKGIIDFNRFATSNPQCLNEEEYLRAMHEQCLVQNGGILNNEGEMDMSQKIDFYLEDHAHIALNDLLKMTGIADSGGSAKHMVAEGLINVNGVLELRKTAKIVDGSKVTGKGFEILVHAGFEG